MRRQSGVTATSKGPTRPLVSKNRYEHVPGADGRRIGFCSASNSNGARHHSTNPASQCAALAHE
eukprot:9062431-Alexandrium_andersonii.AAC.1